jgi:hypothetical protein
LLVLLATIALSKHTVPQRSGTLKAMAPRALVTRLGLLVAVSFAGASSIAHAAPPRRVDLDWSQEDPGCLAAADLAVAVERTLGRAVFHEDAPPFARIVGKVARRAGAPPTFAAEITLHDRSGAPVDTRSLDTPADCRRLDEAIAVVVTLMIDGLEETPTPLHVPVEAPRPPPPLPPVRVTEEAPASLLEGGAMAVGGGAVSSLLPGLVGAAVLRGEAAPRGVLPLALTARILTPSEALAGQLGGAFSGWTLDLAACPRWSSERVALGGCIGAGSGAVRGRAVGGLASAASSVRPLATVPVLFEAEVALARPLWLWLEAGVIASALRERWGFVDGSGQYVTVFRPDLLAPTASLGLKLRIGS